MAHHAGVGQATQQIDNADRREGLGAAGKVASPKAAKSHIVEQDYRGVKRVTRPMLGFKSFAAAQSTLTGIALMHMIKKRQRVVEERTEGLTAAEQFYPLAA
jgi:transposase-like protein